MAEKDLDRRGKGSDEVAFFIPKHAQSYACFGMMGHHYSFDKKTPVRVELRSDIKMFRKKQDVMECDASGNPLEEKEEAKPLSYTKTAPPEPSPVSKGDSEVLTTDKVRKSKNSGDPDADKKDKDPEGKDSEGDKKEKGSKGKKGKPKKKKGKKKAKVEEPEEAEVVEDEDEDGTTEILGLNVGLDDDED